MDVSYLREGEKKKKKKYSVLYSYQITLSGMGPCLDSSKYHLSISLPGKVQVERGGHEITTHSESSFLTPIS